MNKKVLPFITILLKRFLFLFLCFALIHHASVHGQTGVRKDSITAILKATPSFSIYKDNYFITGVPMDRGANNHNSDIKMQISFKQRLTNAVMPFKSYLFLTYTQLSFWKIYEKSSPFSETVFNPGIGLGKFIFKEKRQIGILGVQLEHQSNGKDSIYSRSWNFISVSYLAYLSPNKTLFAKTWIPFGTDDNPDLTDYIGFGELTFTWEIAKNKFIVNTTVRKGSQWDVKGSILSGIYYNPLKNSNQFLYVQFFSGYAENLINYNVLTYMVRGGICIRPSVLIF